jgi:hypothetical protein
MVLLILAATNIALSVIEPFVMWRFIPLLIAMHNMSRPEPCYLDAIINTTAAIKGNVKLTCRQVHI